MEDSFSRRLTADGIVKFSSTVHKIEYMAPEIFEISATVDDALKYMTCLFLGHFKSALSDYILYNMPKNGRK